VGSRSSSFLHDVNAINKQKMTSFFMTYELDAIIEIDESNRFLPGAIALRDLQLAIIIYYY
jgi:hypothetical protein